MRYGYSRTVPANAAATVVRSDNDFVDALNAITRDHAEPDALAGLAADRNVIPAAPFATPYAVLSTGGSPRGGTGIILVDRDPCDECLSHGLDRMRRAAGLDELIVIGPFRSWRFADGLPERGEPYFNY